MERRIKRLQKSRNEIQYITDSNTLKELSPFVFFDAGTMKRNDGGLFIGSHPHSGVGIVTYFHGGDLVHGDNESNDGVVRSGGVQYMQTGSGMKHEENYIKPKSVDSKNWNLTINQLWMQLPPEIEDNDGMYQNIQPENIPYEGNVKVVVGKYGKTVSPLKTPFNMTYLDVSLVKDEYFNFKTPPKQTVGFIFPREDYTSNSHGQHSSNLTSYEQDIPLKNLSVLEENEGDVCITASSNARFVLIMSEPHNHPKFIHGGSIHTNETSLEKSIEKIRKIED